MGRQLLFTNPLLSAVGGGRKRFGEGGGVGRAADGGWELTVKPETGMGGVGRDAVEGGERPPTPPGRPAYAQPLSP